MFWLQNADCAEGFDAARDAVEPVTVTALTEQNGLTPSGRHDEACIAGVISGAGIGGLGLVLDRQLATPGRLPLALVGKV